LAGKGAGVIVIIGTVRLPPENLDRARSAMAAMVEASRAEDGCLDYAYAEDVMIPGLIRVMEVWGDQPALEAHRQTAHMAQWRAAWPALGLGDRDLVQYVAAPPERI
jgi:quinol monooxygenase YgiN